MIVSAWFFCLVVRDTLVGKWPEYRPAIFRFLRRCITMGNSCISKDHRRRTLDHGGEHYTEQSYVSSQNQTTNHNSEQRVSPLNQNRQARVQVTEGTPRFLPTVSNMATPQPSFTSDSSYNSDEEETEQVDALMLKTLQVIRTLVDK